MLTSDEPAIATGLPEIPRADQDIVLRDLCAQLSHLAKHVEALTLAIFGAEVAPACRPAVAASMVYGLPSIAQFLGVRENYVRHHLHRGTVPAFRIGDMLCATRADLQAFLERQAATPNGPVANPQTDPTYALIDRMLQARAAIDNSDRSDEEIERLDGPFEQAEWELVRTTPTTRNGRKAMLEAIFAAEEDPFWHNESPLAAALVNVVNAEYGMNLVA